MSAKIAIFHWGEISVHSFYLAGQLSRDGVEVHFYLYTPAFGNRKFYAKTLLQKLQSTNIKVVELRCTSFERRLIQLHNIAELFRYPLPVVFTNPLLPFKTRKVFKSSDYNYVITIAQSSLYWLYKTDAGALQKTIHYSLEVEKTTDPNIRKHSALYALIKKEAKLLGLVKGLIIQSRFRAEALLNSKEFRRDLQVFYIPVSIPGEIITTRSDYLYRKLEILPHQQIVLYFGAVYEERKMDELADAFARITNHGLVLVIHGAGEFTHLAKAPNIKASNVLLEYDDLHLIISSATVGIAFYDNGWPNTRLTAFSSEKIARYLQAGVPFIAFKNESYALLQSEFNCCALIETISELNTAISALINNYERYRNECYKAYNKYYNIKHTIKPLTQFLLRKS